MRSAVRIATTAAASLALVLGCAAAAFADSATINDKRSDVVLSGKVGGNRTAQQRSLAYGFDVKSAKFSLGSKYASVRVNFANLKQDVNYRTQVEFAGRGEEPDEYEGFTRLIAYIRPGGTTAWTFGGNYLCGESDPAVAGFDEETHGGPAVKATVEYGKDGYLYVQFPRKCADMYGPRTIEQKAKFSVESILPMAVPQSAREFVSNTKYKTAKWTDYVRGGPLKP